MREKRSAGFAAAGFLALAAWIAGCGGVDRPDLAPVRGKVTLDGRPLPDARLEFQPVGPWRTSMGVTDARGEYELSYIRDEKGAAVGGHRVRITTVGRTEAEPEIVPAKYNEQTQLEREVTAGRNRIDFKLTSDAP